MNGNAVCAYCQSPQILLVSDLEKDHITPKSRGGTDDPANICLACHKCNQHKAAKIDAIDPASGLRVPLFDPGRQIWSEHFRFSNDGSKILGLTATGRATIEALRMNRPLMINLRLKWRELGWPSE
jgi:hypothetical protein